MNSKIKKVAGTGMFAAVIFVLTMFIKFPVVSGYVHFGDALIYICGMILGGPWAVAAGAIGEGLADIAGGYTMYAPATAVIKMLVVIPFVLIGKNSVKILTPLAALMTVPAGIITISGYFVADLIIDKAYAFADIAGNAVQAFGSAVIFIIIAAAFDKANIKEKIL